MDRTIANTLTGYLVLSETTVRLWHRNAPSSRTWSALWCMNWLSTEAGKVFRLTSSPLCETWRGSTCINPLRKTTSLASVYHLFTLPERIKHAEHYPTLPSEKDALSTATSPTFRYMPRRARPTLFTPNCTPQNTSLSPFTTNLLSLPSPPIKRRHGSDNSRLSITQKHFYDESLSDKRNQEHLHSGEFRIG